MRPVNATQPITGLGPRIWLDRLTRDHLTRGTLQRYIDEGLVEGVSSSLGALADAISESPAYDAAIKQAHAQKQSTEETVLELTLADVTAAADLLRPLYDRTGGERGWVSMDISPSRTAHAAGIVAVAKDLVTRAARPNLFIKIPGNARSLPAVEEAIFAGVLVHVTLLYSAEQYFAAADAFLRGVERRLAAGASPQAEYVASLHVGPWAAARSRVPADLVTPLATAVAQRTYAVHRKLLNSGRWQQLASAGVRPHRLVCVGTTTANDSHALVVLMDGGEAGGIGLTSPGGWDDALAHCERTGVDVYALAARFQDEGLRSFERSWEALVAAIRWKRAALASTQ